MEIVKNVKSTVKPEELVIDEYSVWVSKDVSVISENEFNGYNYTQINYSKDEYILEIDRKRKEDKTGTELALADLAEMLLGGV